MCTANFVRDRIYDYPIEYREFHKFVTTFIGLNTELKKQYPFKKDSCPVVVTVMKGNKIFTALINF